MNARGPIWKISIRTTIEAEDAVTELLNGIFGLPVSSYTDVETGDVTVSTYLAATASKKRRRAAALRDVGALREGLKRIANCGLNIGAGKISIQKVRREDWAESWKRHFKPIELGATLLIKPSWSKRWPRKGQAVIVLDPGLSFGTGQHPTTAFCLEQLAVHHSEFTKRSAARRPPLATRHSSHSLLDIGSGSGILAIAAAKLGYAPVDAFDFDPEAVRIARENARKNRVSQRIHVRRADVTKLPLRSQRKWDLICANLISTLLLEQRPRILSRLRRGGVLIVAGILDCEFALVQRAYERAGLRLIAGRAEKEWRSGAFTHRRHNR